MLYNNGDDDIYVYIYIYRMGLPVDSVQLLYKWLISMVYGRYSEVVNGCEYIIYTYNVGPP